MLLLVVANAYVFPCESDTVGWALPLVSHDDRHHDEITASGVAR